MQPRTETSVVGWLGCHPDVHPSDGLDEVSSEGNCRVEELRPPQVLDWMHLNMFDPNFSCTGKIDTCHLICQRRNFYQIISSKCIYNITRIYNRIINLFLADLTLLVLPSVHNVGSFLLSMLCARAAI